MPETQAARVVARYLRSRSLRASSISPKVALKLWRTCNVRIKKLTSGPEDAAKLQEAKRLYEELTDQLRPLATALEGVSIGRTDEARKFKNLKTWVTNLKRRCNPVWESELLDLSYQLDSNIESLGETLTSLARVADRMLDYQSIPKTISHPKYEIINQHGFRPEECAGILKVLDDATDIFTRAGFGDLAYGKVYLESDQGLGYAGVYQPTQDNVGLNVEANYRTSAVFTLVHEFGHRHWYQRLTSAQRDLYEDMYHSKGGSLDLATRESFWKALEAAGWDHRKAQHLVPTVLQATFTAYWKDRKSSVAVPDPMTATPERLPMLYKQFVLPKKRYVVLDETAIASVTDYGKTDVKEDYADVFAYHCHDKPLTADAAARFKAVTGR